MLLLSSNWYPTPDSNRENFSFWERWLYQFVQWGIKEWHPLMDSNHRMAESKSAALPTWRRGYKILERDTRIELVTKPWQGLEIPLHQSRIKILVESTKSFGPRQWELGYPDFTVPLYLSSNMGHLYHISETSQAVNPCSILMAHMQFITAFSLRASDPLVLVLSECLYASYSLLIYLLIEMSDCSPHNLTKRGSVEFVSCATIVIGTIHLCI